MKNQPQPDKHSNNSMKLAPMSFSLSLTQVTVMVCSTDLLNISELMQKIPQPFSILEKSKTNISLREHQAKKNFQLLSLKFKLAKSSSILNLLLFPKPTINPLKLESAKTLKNLFLIQIKKFLLNSMLHGAAIAKLLPHIMTKLLKDFHQTLTFF